MLSLWLLIAITSQLQAGAPSQAEILETQLPAYTAVVERIEPTGVKVRLASETRLIPFDQLLRTRFKSADKTGSTEKIAVELADGSSIVCSQITSDGKNVKLTWSDEDSISVPARQVDNCLLQPLDSVREKQWRMIVESRTSGDALVVQRSPESLDRIEGIINEVTADVVKFKFDGQAIDVQRTKLAGWKYFAAANNDRPKLLAIVRDRHGSNWMTQSIVGDWSKAGGKGLAQLKLMCGLSLDIPTASIIDIDFSFGSMRFLADLDPIERKVQPRLTLAIALPEADQLFGPRAAAAETQRGATAGPGVEFMGSGTVVYRVPDEFRRLLGTVALTPEGPQFVPCKAQILIEEKVVWERTLTSPNDLVPVEIDVDAGKRVRLTVQAESQQPVGDHVTWRQLRFVK